MMFSVEESDFSRALVQFIAACGGARACWYSLKILSNDIPNLPEAMGLTYNSTMYMFQCCGLASKRLQVDEWVFLPQKYNVFMSLYGLGKKTDVISSKVTVIDGANGSKKRKQCWFIRLGGEDLSKITFAGYPVPTPPRISGVDAVRSAFQDTLWKLGTKHKKVQDQQDYTMFQKLLNAAISSSCSKTLEQETSQSNHDPGLVVSDGSTLLLPSMATSMSSSPRCTSSPSFDAAPATPIPNGADEDSNTGTSPSAHKGLLLHRIRVHLLPLLMEKDAIRKMEQFWLATVDEAEIEAALLTIVGCIQQEKEKKLSLILKTDQFELSPNTVNNISKYPKLRQYGIPLDDKRVHQSILRDLYTIHKRNSAGGLSSLATTLPSGEERALIFVPQSRTYRTMWKENEIGWFTELLNALGGGKNVVAGSTQAIQFICHYLARKHHDCFLEAVKLTGSQLVEPLDPIATFALQSVCNLPSSKMKLLKRFLESELGVKIFSTPTEIRKVIGMDGVIPLTGIFNYSGSARIVDVRSKDKIPWMYKSAKEILRLLIRMQVREKQEAFYWNHLDVSTCIDHGKGFL